MIIHYVGRKETKPFTNFSVFHDNLIMRLKALSQIQLDFDRRCTEAEARFTEKLSDTRKQLDKFESSVKTYAETKAGWRRKFSVKEGELQVIEVCVFMCSLPFRCSFFILSFRLLTQIWLPN
jgi:hypothetical protein